MSHTFGLAIFVHVLIKKQLNTNRNDDDNATLRLFRVDGGSDTPVVCV